MGYFAGGRVIAVEASQVRRVTAVEFGQVVGYVIGLEEGV